MNASHEWLRAFVPHSRSPDEIRNLISAHVATVDGLTQTRADLAPIVVGRVVAADRHPDSDHLWVTKVDDGSGEPLDVVCGAPNVTVGTPYPFARTGTVMPGGLKIERRKIRGAVSNGMLCSARELGLGTDHQGIMALTVDVAPGTPLLDAVPLGDWTYEIDVLPNRPDLLSHVGLARELSALTRIPMAVPPELRALPEVLAPVTAELEGKAGSVTIRIDDIEGCPRYFAAIIRDVKVGPSPQWLVDRLASVGVRSISNVVDVTNYFLHGFGQPMHAFDLGRLAGPGIIVRRAKKGEKITTLDGVDRVLDDSMLLIADHERAAAVAGVIGGRDSEVTDATTDILLEVACFEPRSIRRTRSTLGISTDASHRFERGTDPAEPAHAGVLAAALIAALSEGHIDGAPVIVGRKPRERAPVKVRPARLSRLLGGEPVTGREVVERMGSIGFKVTPGGENALDVVPPSWRHDVERDVDVLEEIARLRGYDTLPEELSAFKPSAVPDHPLHATIARVSAALVAAGFAEARPLPFVAGSDDTHVRVTNPIAEDQPHLRTSILETLSSRAEYNLARREGDLRLFEIGSVFEAKEGGVAERCAVGVLLMGRRHPLHFSDPPAVQNDVASSLMFDRWDAKAVAQTILRTAFPAAKVAIDPSNEAGVLWTISADGTRVGSVASLALDSPPWASSAYGVEIVLGRLSNAPIAPPGQRAYVTGDPPRARHVTYRALPVMPAAEFDLALLVPDGVQAAQVEALVRRTAGDLLERLVLFDRFRGKGVPDGHTSLAWRLTFRHPERTLNDKEIGGRRQKILSTLEKELGVVARTG